VGKYTYITTDPGIYALCDPVTYEVRYVGHAANIRTRFAVHRHDAHGDSSRSHYYVYKWMRSLNGDPHVMVLGAPVPLLKYRVALEREWIRYGKLLGWRLTNLTDGGEGLSGVKLTEERKAQIAARSKNYRHTEESKAKIAEAHIGMTPTDKARENMSAAQKARYQDPDQYAQIRAMSKRSGDVTRGKKRGPYSPERREAIRRGQIAAMKEGRGPWAQWYANSKPDVDGEPTPGSSDS
jgi:hypothetical protein